MTVFRTDVNKPLRYIRPTLVEDAMTETLLVCEGLMNAFWWTDVAGNCRRLTWSRSVRRLGFETSQKRKCVGRIVSTHNFHCNVRTRCGSGSVHGSPRPALCTTWCRPCCRNSAKADMRSSRSAPCPSETLAALLVRAALS